MPKVITKEFIDSGFESPNTRTKSKPCNSDSLNITYNPGTEIVGLNEAGEDAFHNAFSNGQEAYGPKMKNVNVKKVIIHQTNSKSNSLQKLKVSDQYNLSKSRSSNSLSQISNEHLHFLTMSNLKMLKSGTTQHIKQS